MTTSNLPYRLLSAVVSLSMVIQLFIPPWLLVQAGPIPQPEVNLADQQEKTVDDPSLGPSKALQANASNMLDSSISISRVQSSYLSGGQVTITYTVSNNQPPTQLPAVPATATVTDTVDIIAGSVLTEDINTLHNTTVTTTLMAGTSLLSASDTPLQNGSSLTWNLADIAPQQNQVVTLTVQVPATAADFVDLDNGAAVSANLWGYEVTGSSRPAVLAPDSVDPSYTQATVDANPYDQDMLWQTAQFNQDPNQIFSYVRSLAFDPYAGSLRGTRGTLWGMAGNAVDQSSLLIAALRAAGIPARYRHGSLSMPDAQTLIADMFPAAVAVSGYLPAGTETADPIQDMELISLVQDHWWVEAYLPSGGWTNLDPSFATANMGDRWATPATDGSDRLAELPRELRHTITLELEVEQYSSFPLGGSNLTRFTPLTATYATAELAARSLTVGHLVETDAPGGMVFSTVTHTYVPFFDVDGEPFITAGDEFQDILSNFPLSSVFTLGEWLTITTTDLDGQNERFTRELKDLIGLDVRMNGGQLDIALPADNAPFITPTDVYVMTAMPNQLRASNLYERQRTSILADMHIMAQSAQILGDENDSVTDTDRQKAALDAQLAYARFLSILAFDFTDSSDASMAAIEKSLQVKLFQSSPRIIINASEDNGDDTATQTIDLRHPQAEAIVYPGQSTTAAFTAQWIKGILESRIEGEVLQDATGLTPLTTARIFDAMAAQQIEPIWVTPDELALLDIYSLEPAAYAYAVEALLAGKSILIPSQGVEIDGEEVLGWWEVDPETGETISVLENGLHVSAIEYAVLQWWEKFLTFYGPAKLGYDLDKMFDWINCNLASAGGGGGGCGKPPKPPFPAPGPPPPFDSLMPGPGPLPAPGGLSPRSLTALPQAAESISNLFSSSWHYLPAHLCPVDNCGIEQFIEYDLAPGTLPLPDIYFGHFDEFLPSPTLGAQITVTDNLAGGAPALTVTMVATETRAVPYGSTEFEVNLEANFDEVINLYAAAPGDWYLRQEDADSISVHPSPQSLPGDYAVWLVAQSPSQPQVVATTIHTITVPVVDALEMRVIADSRLTIPMGQSLSPSSSGQTNDGEPEIPDSAFHIGILNSAPITKSINVTVSGAPSGWIILNGLPQTNTTLTLGPNQRVVVGLYVLPPTLPAPGTNFNLDISVDDGGLLSQNEVIPWSMPGQPFNQLEVVPARLYMEANSSQDVTLTMGNVGNSPGTFPITVTVPISTWQISDLTSPISLNPGEVKSPTFTLSIDNAALGQRYPLQAASTAPGSYTQYAFAEVQIVSSQSGAIFNAADSCNLGQESLSAALETLALAVVDLEYWCDVGDCPLVLRDQVVAATESIADYAWTASPSLEGVASLQSIAAEMSSHTGDADLTVDIANLSTAVADLETELCELEQHLPRARFTPLLDAILLGQSTTYTLTVTNEGTLTTNYTITTTLPGGNSVFNESIPPRQTIVLGLPMTPGSIGPYNLLAEVVVNEPEVQKVIATGASARLNVVDKFLQLTAVTADPAFVESGTSSTDLSIEINNVAGIAQDVTARTEILAPGGGISYTADIPLTILIGNPRTYSLATVDTSGWATGAYTIGVELLDETMSLVPDGRGHGFLNVGQALAVTYAIEPQIVSPGTVTVTTVISSEILGNTIMPAGDLSFPLWPATGLRSADDEEIEPEAISSWPTMTGNEPQSTAVIVDRPMDPAQPAPATAGELPSAALSVSIAGVYTRTEQNEAGVNYGGSWSTSSDSRASGGSYARGNEAGDIASFTFSGSWVNLGFMASSAGGQAEIFLDGNNLGMIDLYRRELTPVSFVYDSLVNASHTISVSVSGTANPLASAGSFVQLDYIDHWDGTPLPDGTFEQNDASRVMLSNGWGATQNLGIASGGSFVGNNEQSAWFPFSGTSFTYHAIARSNAGPTRLYLDGQYLTTVDLFSYPTITRTFAFTGFVPSPHILQVTTYRGSGTVDAFTTPAEAPFTDPDPVPTGFTRYEEDHPAFLYNGLPFTQTVQTWSRIDSANANQASGGQFIVSDDAGDTVSLTFDGQWASIGFRTSNTGGSAELFLDGASLGTITTFRHDWGVTSHSFELSSGSHTISMTLQGDGFVRLDYVDVWDGSSLASDTFQGEANRVYRSDTWIRRNQSGAAPAMEGTFLRSDEGAIWFPFTGESASLHLYNDGTQRDAKIYLDDQYQGIFTLGASGETTPTISFGNLSNSIHVLRVEAYRGTTGIDGFTTPAVGALYSPPAIGDFHRYEEDDPAFLFNGLPFTQTVTSWNRVDNTSSNEASRAQYIHSNSNGDTISFTFSGVWASVGFASDSGSGQVEIFLDGNSQGVFDTYRRMTGVSSKSFAGLDPGVHTLTMIVQGDGFVRLDYVDVWNGNTLPDGTFDTGQGRIYLSDGWQQRSSNNARNNNYLRAGTGTAWFPFTGPAVSYEVFNDSTVGRVRLFIDDALKGIFDLSMLSGITPTLSFDGLGSGIHVMRLEAYKDQTTINAFITPGSSPFVQPPVVHAMQRYEEEHPAILYNGLPFTQTVTSWGRVANFNANDASGGQYIVSSNPGDILSLSFTGAKVGLGFITSRFGGQAQVFIDGSDQGTIDLYSRDGGVVSYYYDVAGGSHVISATVLASNHPNVDSNGRQIRLDYIDVWDGSLMAPGNYEELDSLVYTSDGFNTIAEPDASGGQYRRGGQNLWFHFTGDSVTYQPMAHVNGARFGRVYIDGVYQGIINLYAVSAISRSFTFNNLGAGGHVLHINADRGEGSLDTFVVPGSGQPYSYPSFSGLVRYEENHPALRYNGYTYDQRPASWGTNATQTSSEGYVTNSSTVGNILSFTFDGVWVNLGIRTTSNGGTADVYIDGANQGTVDFSSASDMASSVQYGDLLTTTHTISLVVTSGVVWVDYFDVWDGSVTDDAFQNTNLAVHNGRTHIGGWMNTYSHPNAIEEDYTSVGIFNFPGSVWYTFVGDSFTYYAFGRNNNGSVEVYVDGILSDTVSTRYDFTPTPLAYHFTGLEYGAHVVRIRTISNIRVDGFAANPASLTPYQPIVEWSDSSGAGNGAPLAGTFGVIATVAAGDVDGDGSVELAVAADDSGWGTLYLYRGDGSDTGDGDPIIWKQVLGGDFTTRANLGAPVMVDLDGNPGSEIVVAGNGGVYAYYHDGNLFWRDASLSGNLARGNPAVGNLDLDAAPEIVVNMNRTLVVYEADGSQAYSTTLPAEVGLPLLADMTGDGLLDIVVADWNENVHLFDYNLGNPQLVWSTPISTAVDFLFGAPAVADIDGQQPGGDPGPEIAITSFGLLTVIDADGSILWTTPLDDGAPGGVSIADVDGDGEVEIVTGSKYDDGVGTGRIYVVNADGSILWWAPAYDSTSANSASVLDLNGDGIYEIAWNGKEQGFTIFNGVDGSILFNEPLILSHTATDYPNIVDVDNDGFAEVIVPALRGIHVVGFDHGWAPARPVWNQHSYHITNINDGLTVPFSEFNSWQVHNTYRTQTPLRNPAPSYGVVLTYTAAVTNVTVLTPTFSLTPTMTPPAYRLDYLQEWYQPLITHTVESQLSDMQVGESRRVAEGIEVIYTLSSGENRLVLPPQYVMAPHLASIAPLSQAAAAGSTVIFTATLTNPNLQASDTYTTVVSGLPDGWGSLASPIPLAAGESKTVPLTITIPFDAEPGEWPLFIDISGQAGGQDTITAYLIIFDGLDIDLTPPLQTAGPGVAVTYTLTLTNHDTVARTYTLTSSGLAQVSLPGPVQVEANSARTLSISASAVGAGPHPFTVHARAGSDGAVASADAILNIPGNPGIALSLTPDTAAGGPGTTINYTLHLTNNGTLPDTFDLDVDLPAGWSSTLLNNGQAISQVSLTPHVFNRAELLLQIVPAANAAPGAHDFQVTAQSQSDPAINAMTSGTAQLGASGVQLQIQPEHSIVDPTNVGQWTIVISNTGSVADTFDLVAAGALAGSAQFDPSSFSLDAGQTAAVIMTANNLSFLLPGSYPFAVTSQSQSDSSIHAEATATATLTGYEAVEMAWRPASQTITDTFTATFMLVVTNTGNVETTYSFNLDSVSLEGDFNLPALQIPAHSSLAIPVMVQVPGAGYHSLDGEVSSIGGGVGALGTANLVVVSTGNQTPSVEAGNDLTVDEGASIRFLGNANDPENGALTIEWDFGDGNRASGSLTMDHVYRDNGQYVVTLTVIDNLEARNSDQLLVTVNNVAAAVNAGDDRLVAFPQSYTFSGSFNDPGSLDTHIIEWDFGDGNSASGTLTPTHSYAVPGLYTVTLTVTDDDGGVGSDTMQVDVKRIIFLPLIKSTP